MHKRILIFSLSYYPHVGGAEVAIKEITDRIQPSDIEFEMLTLRFSRKDAKKEQIGNVLVHRVGFGSAYISKILFIPLVVWAAWRLHRKNPLDGAWAMLTYMALPASFMRFVGVSIPYVLTLQDGDPFEQVFLRWYIRPVLPLLRYGFRRARAVSALSTYLSSWAHSMGYEGVVRIIPNGADTKRFREASACDIEKKEGEIWLVTSSRLVHKNAVDDVIRALSFLPAHVHFLVLGSGPDLPMLTDLAASLGVSARVHFIGFVSHVQLPAYLRACDIFIRPSRTEGFGASFPEAMAAGLPVIATQEGGIRDFLFDAKRNPDTKPTGWAVDRDAPEQIAEAVKDIVARPEQAAQIKKNASELVEKKYDWSYIARDSQDFFEALWSSVKTHTLRVLVATPLYPPEPGGPATYSHILEHGLPRRGIEVDVLPFSTVRHLPKGIRHIRYLFYVLARGRKADLILALDPVSVGLPSRIVAGLLGKPFIVKVVGDYAWEQGRQRHGVWLSLDEFVGQKRISLPSRILRFVQTLVARTAKAVLVPSTYLESIVRAWGVQREKVTVIYNAVAAVTPGELPTGIKNIHGPIVLTVGRLVPWKGIRGVIEALSEVRAEEPGATLVIVGEGPEEENLKRHAARHLSEGAVVFTGRLEPPQTRAAIARCDVFLLNSTYEGLSHVLIEAMSLSRPIIATKAGGNAELIADQETGLLVSVGDVKALAGALLYLLQNPEQAQALGKRAQERAEDFSEGRMIEETAAYLRSIV